MRHLKNTSIHESKEEIEEILIEYMDNLIGMGYEEEWRVKVLSSSLKGYRRILKLVEKGNTERNRQGASTRTSRRWKKLMGPSTWFKRKATTYGDGAPSSKRRKRRSEETTPEAVMFIPTTPEGRLKRDLQEMEKGLGFRTTVKYVETVGTSVANSLVKRDPWEIHKEGLCLQVHVQSLHGSRHLSYILWGNSTQLL